MVKKILVIDDEELIIRSLAKLMEMKGYEPTVAKRGQDAIVIAKKENFDLILSDVRMPGVNGIEVIKKIYEMQIKRNIKKTPVIFITGYANKDCEQEAKSLSPSGYIYKPFDISNLVNQIEAVLIK